MELLQMECPHGVLEAMATGNFKDGAQIHDVNILKDRRYIKPSCLCGTQWLGTVLIKKNGKLVIKE